MNILALADIHGDISRFEEVYDHSGGADLVLLTGDVTHFGGGREAARIVAAIRRRQERILAVPGNCDTPAVDACFREQGISLHGRGLVIEGLGFAGVGKSLPCPGATPNEAPESELAECLEYAVAQLPPHVPWILLSHQPPSDTLNDQVGSGQHVGSPAIRGLIERRQPLVCFTGHIHEGVGIDTIGRTKVVNPGPLRTGRYAHARIGTEVELLEIRSLREG